MDEADALTKKTNLQNVILDKMQKMMNILLSTSQANYITGKAALNVPNDDGSFADWHFDEVFLSGRGKIRIAGKDAPETTALLGSYGIRECSSVLKRFGLAIAPDQKIYAANHIRALLDMVLASVEKNKLPEHVSMSDMLDSRLEVEEFKAQVAVLKKKINNPITLSLLEQWEQKQT